MQERKQVLNSELKQDNVVSGLQYIQSVFILFYPFSSQQRSSFKTWDYFLEFSSYQRVPSSIFILIFTLKNLII